MAEERKLDRDFANRGLKDTLPRPNILRIEVLDGNSRNRYLGGLQKIIDVTRNAIDDNTKTHEGSDVFYGFIQDTETQGYGLTAKWDVSATSGGVLGAVKAIIDGSGTPEVKQERAANTAKLGSVFETASDAVRELTGINAKVTGSSTLKRYSGTAFDKPFDVKCGWYLPEQFNLCVNSLKILHKMIYPIKVSDDKLSTAVPEAIANLVKETGENTVTEIFATPIAEGVKKAGNLIVKAVTEGNRFFGRELTFDPLPVRICLGQYMDIEPLVIAGMSITFSKETFINADGRHVPLSCTVNIQFNLWMNPAPDLNFISLLGHEMFGNDTNNTK